MVITVSSIKGGVGKSSVVLLLANNLASRGRKVLVIDTDLNNTVTVYYTMGIGRIGEICERQNVSLAFAQGKLDGKNIIQSRKENIFIVPSSLRLLDQRSMESVEIKRVLRSPKGFDDIIIDTSPTYDSIVAGAWMAADLILSPVKFTEYNFNMLSQKYQLEQIELDEKIQKLKAALAEGKQSVEDARKWIEIVKQYSEPTELTAELLNNMIDKIVVHEAIKYENGFREQKIEIYYRFVGKID